MTRSEYLRQLDIIIKRLRAHYAKMVDAKVRAIKITDLQNAIAANDETRILAIAALDAPDMGQVLEAVRAAYIDAGVVAASEITGRFDVRHAAAERWIGAHSSELVTRVSDASKDAIRAVLKDALAHGQNPRSTALDIVGRVSETGRRAGGIIGLTGPQSEYVRRARVELRELSPHYFTRALRDKRFDAAIRRAMRGEVPLAAEQIDRIAGRYADRLLKLRGDNVARTETLASLNGGRLQAFEQAVDRGEIEAEDVVKKWDATMDRRTRATHAAADGLTVAMDEPFIVGGYPMMHPGDGDLGAPAEEIINCRCYCAIRVNHMARQRRMEMAA